MTAVFAAQDKISQLYIFQGDVLIFAARWGDSEMPGFGVVSSQPYLQSSIQWLSLSRRMLCSKIWGLSDLLNSPGVLASTIHNTQTPLWGLAQLSTDAAKPSAWPVSI